ncbi:MAG: hypothetical protein WAV11_00585 [Minisyncoccia bacterium]
MKKISLILLLAIFASPLFALAQTTHIEPTDGTNIAKPVSGLFDCFEQYNFGSISIEPLRPVSNVRAGSVFSSPLVITNTNNYPIVNGAVYVKILKADDSIINFRKGPTVVEQTYLVRNLNLAAKETKQVNFSWKVPLFLTSGKYSLVSYFVANDKFNYSGLSFTNDVVAGLIEFNVNSENEESVYLDKNNVKVNGQNYDPAAFSANTNGPVKIQIDVVSEAKTLERFPVTWYVYAWDGLSDANFLFSKQDGAFLKPGERKTLELTITDDRYPVYYVTAQGEYKDARNFVNVRYVLDNVTGVRINSAAVSAYPLKTNQEAQVYACFHSMSMETVTNTKLVISLKDTNGNVITENIYTGDMGPNVTGFRQVFSPTSDLYNFSVESNLYRDDKLVDSATVNYVCENILKEGCPSEMSTVFDGFLAKLFMTPYNYIIYTLLGLLILWLVVFIIKKAKK